MEHQTITRRRRTWLVVGLAAALVVAASATVAVRQVGSTQACPAIADHPDWSVARRWDEALLDAIRRALPAPTLHARNLFHVSAAMWDAWAVYDPHAAGYFVTEKHSVRDSDLAGARNEAISYAAYRLLTSRYIKAMGADQSLSEFDDLMDSLCYPLNVTSTEGDSPSAVGNRIAAAVIAYGLSDGSNQAGGYSDPEYAPVNPPLVVAQSGTTIVDPNRWQPLQLEHMISQNGVPVVNGVQQFVGPHWGGVKGFALPAGERDRLPIDPGQPPRLGDAATDQAYRDEALTVIRDSAALDTSTGVTIDISPGAIGSNTLGTNDGHGRPLNPATNQPYPPELVDQGDFTRALAEFWADGPNSETPPGHWNVLANYIADHPLTVKKIGGTGSVVDDLEWDVKVYFALNAAVHEAACACWAAKRAYGAWRPLSGVRYLGGLGQSSDPGQPHYDPNGLPLITNLIELVTSNSVA